MVNISDAEWKIMNVLWEKSPSTIMQITKWLYETTGWTKHTVMTLLKRLEDKGAVYYEEGERAKQYYAKIPQNEAVVEEAKSFLQKAFKGKLGTFMAGFFAVAIILALGFMGNMVQSNSIGDAFFTAFGIPKLATGIVIAGISAFIFLDSFKSHKIFHQQ